MGRPLPWKWRDAIEDTLLTLFEVYQPGSTAVRGADSCH
jgi:hypothetical protein